MSNQGLCDPTDNGKDDDLMHIIHVTAEMAPIAKVGGLGDVVTGRARASLLRGHKVDVVLPFYECIHKEQISDLQLITTYNSYHDGNWVPINAFRGVVSSIPVVFVQPDNQFFKGHSVYGGSYNELEAYLFFSRACLEWMQVCYDKFNFHTFCYESSMPRDDYIYCRSLQPNQILFMCMSGKPGVYLFSTGTCIIPSLLR